MPRPRPPDLTRQILNSRQALTGALDSLLGQDPTLARRARQIARLQGQVRLQVSAQVWKTLLTLEELQVRRFSDSLDRVTRWAFGQGGRNARKPR